LNPLQECLQPEGEPNYRSVLDKIRYLTKSLDVPVIVKEVGFGISRETASKLASCNVAGIEIAGFGGTNFVVIEKYRAESSLDLEELKVYETFRSFGIPTVISLCEVLEVFNGLIIASGGVRTGLDIAKLIALGAHLTAIARPFLELALEGQERVEKYVRRVHRELKIAMFMTGARKVEELREKPIVVHQDILTWLIQRRLSKCLKRICGDNVLEMMRCT
jgi:isopentenyl-diphosphate delta-isomerase